MRRFAIVPLLASVLSVAVYADTSQEDLARIQLLEDQVLELKAEMRRLRLLTAELRTQLSQIDRLLENKQISASSSVSEEQSPCAADIQPLAQRLEQLRALGFKDGHPDVRRLAASIEKLRTDCAAGRPIQ